MIPKNSTPIKNEILTDIFAKRLLTLEEIAIVSYIMRWSWGFDGVERRQDWTKKLTNKQIAEDIGMHESHLSNNIKRMIAENKILVKDNCYQFNEHYEDWKVTEKVTNKKLPKREQKVTEKVTKVTEKVTPTGVKLLPDKPLLMPKETLKETLKEKSDVFQKTFQDFKIMRNKIKKPLTIRAEKMILNKLEKLSNDENIQVKILEQSILHCWQDVYPLKEEKIIDPNKSGYEQFMEKVLNDRR